MSSSNDYNSLEYMPMQLQVHVFFCMFFSCSFELENDIKVSYTV